VRPPPAPVVTPEAVPLELEPAGIGSRFVAIALDWFIQGVLGFALLFGLAASVAGDVPFSGALFPLFGFLVLFGYPIGFETLWRGRTPGKAALGLRVVTAEGAPVRFRHAAIRATLGLVDFALTFGAVAVITAFLTRNNQRIGDLVAGTIVLRERSGLRAPQPAAFAVPPGLETYAASLDTRALTVDDYRAVRAYLLRAPALPAHVAAALATQLATPLRHRLRPLPPDGVPPADFLACVAAAYQARQRPPVEPPPSPAPPPAPTDAAPPPAAPPSPPPPGGFTPMS
jgi:uncharacterized RDD family membrane protein YckC